MINSSSPITNNHYINPTFSFPSYSTLISKSNSDGSTRNYAITVSQTTITLDYLPSTFTSGFRSVSLAGLSLDPGSWHHIVVTAVGTVASFYVNGSFTGGQSLVGSIVDDPNRNILLGQLFPCKFQLVYLGEVKGGREREGRREREGENWEIFHPSLFSIFS